MKKFQGVATPANTTTYNRLGRLTTVNAVISRHLTLSRNLKVCHGEFGRSSATMIIAVCITKKNNRQVF